MDINTPQFEAFEERFQALAEDVEEHEGPNSDLGSTQLFLCLYGENGIDDPEEELALLKKLEEAPREQLRKIEVDKDYWQDIVLFLP